MEENVSHLVTPWPPSTLDLGTLSISALYSNPIRYKETSSEKKLKPSLSDSLRQNEKKMRESQPGCEKT
jgi:hypothetical protein